MTHWISFPGLGIEPFYLNRVAFRIFGLEVMWYGILIVIGMILAFAYCRYRGKQYGVSFDDLLDLAIFTITFGIIGARLYYVVFYDGVYESFWDLIDIRQGGLAIYGGVIFGAIMIILVARHKKIYPPKLLDIVAPSVLIGQIIGRWGNFVNAEAHGGETSAFCRMGIATGNASASKWQLNFKYYHPTFLYESLWNVIGFVLINVFYKKKKFDGEIVLWYFGWYGLGRTFIEMLRTDSLYIGSLRVSSVFGFLCFVAALTADIIIRMKLKKREATAVAAEPEVNGGVDSNTEDKTGEDETK